MVVVLAFLITCMSLRNVENPPRRPCTFLLRRGLGPILPTSFVFACPTVHIAVATAREGQYRQIVFCS
jgi:hypothetical protein